MLKYNTRVLLKLFFKLLCYKIDFMIDNVVIPLLGCGVGGLKKEKVFLMIKSMFKKSKVDLDVVIYFHNKKDYYEFVSKEL